MKNYTITKVMSVDVIDRKIVDDTRIQYLAVLISFLAEAYYPDELGDALNKRKSHLQEELILDLCEILKNKGDKFWELYDALKTVAGKNECIVGIEPKTVLSKEDLAAWISAEMQELFTPLHIPQDTPGFYF